MAYKIIITRYCKKICVQRIAKKRMFFAYDFVDGVI